jgi:hypothetical protein
MSPRRIRLLTALCIVALPLAAAPARAQTTAPNQTAPNPAPAAAAPIAQDVLLKKLDAAIYTADKARSTAAKARTTSYALVGITLLNLLATVWLLLGRGAAGIAATSGSAVGAMREFIDRQRHARLLRRQRALARAMADLSATFSLYQDQAKEVDAVMNTVRDKLTELEADVHATSAA